MIANKLFFPLCIREQGRGREGDGKVVRLGERGHLSNNPRQKSRRNRLSFSVLVVAAAAVPLTNSFPNGRKLFTRQDASGKRSFFSFYWCVIYRRSGGLLLSGGEPRQWAHLSHRTALYLRIFACLAQRFLLPLFGLLVFPPFLSVSLGRLPVIGRCTAEEHCILRGLQVRRAVFAYFWGNWKIFTVAACSWKDRPTAKCTKNMFLEKCKILSREISLRNRRNVSLSLSLSLCFSCS